MYAPRGSSFWYNYGLQRRRPRKEELQNFGLGAGKRECEEGWYLFTDQESI